MISRADEVDHSGQQEGGFEEIQKQGSLVAVTRVA